MISDGPFRYCAGMDRLDALESGDYDEAERVFRSHFERHPGAAVHAPARLGPTRAAAGRPRTEKGRRQRPAVTPVIEGEGRQAGRRRETIKEIKKDGK